MHEVVGGEPTEEDAQEMTSLALQCLETEMSKLLKDITGKEARKGTSAVIEKASKLCQYLLQEDTSYYGKGVLSAPVSDLKVALERVHAQCGTDSVTDEGAIIA
eukprot:2440589-Karenia_brevis.AAC.1